MIQNSMSCAHKTSEPNSLAIHKRIGKVQAPNLEMVSSSRKADAHGAPTSLKTMTAAAAQHDFVSLSPRATASARCHNKRCK